MWITVGPFRPFKPSPFVFLPSITNWHANEMSSVLNSTRFSSKLSNVSTPFSVTRPKPSLRSLRKRSINVHCVSFPIRTRLESCRCSSSDVSETVHPVQIKRMESDQELIQFLQMVLQGYFEVSLFLFCFLMFLVFFWKYVPRRSFRIRQFVHETKIGNGSRSFTPTLSIQWEQNTRSDLFGEKSSFEDDRLSFCGQIAVQENSEVAGGCEICVSERLSGICPVGVPVAEKDGFYIQNLIVQPEQRRKVRYL